MAEYHDYFKQPNPNVFPFDPGLSRLAFGRAAIIFAFGGRHSEPVLRAQVVDAVRHYREMIARPRKSPLA